MFACVSIAIPLHSLMQINTNGFLSFERPVEDFSPDLFPEPHTTYLVAPYWADINIDNALELGQISYEVHTADSDSTLLSQVSFFISEQWEDSEEFIGRWMLVAEWNDVPPFGSTTEVEFIILVSLLRL